eukprot:TRINITY_DN995_c0_g3_i3.p1 TRINITY_DN995_c0_g3~~TRINITY_DN995_c0_g3_i3.p1  ORF type:complete len:217 (-),score=30.97 TRINITY_DN995_c0_g3_i3:1739-2389(-)
MDALVLELWEEVLFQCDDTTTGSFLRVCKTASALAEDVWQRKCHKFGVTVLDGSCSWAQTYRNIISIEALVGRTFCYGHGGSLSLTFVADERTGKVRAGPFPVHKLQYNVSTALGLLTLPETATSDGKEIVIFDLARWADCPLPRLRRALLMFPIDCLRPNARIFVLTVDKHVAEELQKLKDWLVSLDCWHRVQQLMGTHASQWLRDMNRAQVTFF